jgi:hypothetical protein
MRIKTGVSSVGAGIFPSSSRSPETVSIAS